MNLLQLLSKRTYLFVLLFTIVGALLHFYNLNWGAPFYFHPDERNIASAVSRLQFPNQMNPQFFAYGSVPIYIIYFTGTLLSKFQTPVVSFELAIQISRAYSALFATALIPILFLIGKKLKNETVGLAVAFLTTSSVGFIQYAHFGTFEMWLTFFSILLFWICLQKITRKTLLLMGIVFGILVATKISSLVLAPLLVLPLLLQNSQKNQKMNYLKLPINLKLKLSTLFNILNLLKKMFFVLLVAFFVYYITNPFVFLDTPSFKNSMNYESGLALGKFPVFYTGEFFNTIPIIFQFTSIYPFLLNPLITVLFIPAFVYLTYKTFLTKNISFIILISFFLILFLSQAFLFAKWTRYMIPTLPFIFLITALTFSDVIANAVKQSQRLPRRLPLLAMTIIIATNILFAFSYFITAFVRPDTRVSAYHFAQKTVPFATPILSEVYDLGIVPFNDSYTNIILFNFYELDNNSPDVTVESLQHELAQREYIVLPSQRIIKTRLINKEKFPNSTAFYKSLSNGSLGYQKIYETPCDLFCKITYLGNPTYRFEETANVFDRPTVFIFKKQ